MINDIKTINKYRGNNTDHFYFADDSLPQEFFKEFSKQIIKDSEIKNTFEAYLRCDDWVDYDILKLAKQAGFNHIKIAPESYEPRLIRLVNKGFSIGNVKRTINYCESLDLVQTVHFMVGLPTQTEEELLRDFKVIKELKNNVKKMHIALSTFRLEVGSYIYQHPEKFKIKLLGNKNAFLATMPFKQLNPSAISTERTLYLVEKHLIYTYAN